MDRANELLNSYKIPLLLSFLGLILIIGGIISSNITPKKPKTFLEESKIAEKTLLKQIKVDISGEVEKPGVYELTSEARIEDAVKVANGFTPEADPEYIEKKLNLSQKLIDGMKIYIPKAGEQAVLSGSSSVAAGVSSLIGINSASYKDLESLPGIGPATAEKITNARPYQSLEELISKKAISRSVFEKIKDKIDLN